MTGKRKSKLAAWLEANAPGLGGRSAVPGAGQSATVRPKRKPVRAGFLWSLQDRLYVPMPGLLKCEVMRIAREANVSQAELGLLIVQAAVNDQAWLAAVLAARES